MRKNRTNFHGNRETLERERKLEHAHTQREPMILDVGCGTQPKGDVNVDLFLGFTGHRQPPTVIDPHKIVNFVKADALHLPFRDGGFHTVYSSHTIEHVSNPVQFLRECIRVAKRKVVLKLPHRYWRRGLRLRQPSGHKHYFTVKWFTKALTHYMFDITVGLAGKPHDMIPIIKWPHEMTVTIYLRGDICPRGRK